MRTATRVGPRTFRLSDRVPAVLLLAACAMAWYLGSPRDGEFWWSEAPRNALNGVFILDLLKDRPVADPVGWAWRYYAQYPSLTIGFYPPGLHAVLAAFFAVLGVSHATAAVCMASFAFALGLGVHALVGRFAPPAFALATAIGVLAMPELMIWGQQVMLEVPMLAAATWAAVFAVRHLESGSTGDLWLAAAFTVAALYFKQTAAVAALAILLTLLLHGGWRPLLRPPALAAAAVSAVALVPLILLQLRFGDFNVTSMVHRADVDIDRFGAEGLLWYPRRLADMAGWPMLAAALAGLAALPLGRVRRNWSPALTLLLTWLAGAAVLITLIHLKETRHGLVMLLPLAAFAGLLHAWWPTRAARGTWIVVAAALLAFGLTLASVPTPRIHGVEQAARRVLRLAGPDQRIAFSGTQDGSFSFNVRVLDPERRTRVVRVDKLLLDITIMPELGLNAKDLSAEEIAAMFDRHGIRWVVASPTLWTTEPVMARLLDVLESPRFERVDRIPVSGVTTTREFRIYRNRGELKSPPDEPPTKSSIAGGG